MIALDILIHATANYLTTPLSRAFKVVTLNASITWNQRMSFQNEVERLLDDLIVKILYFIIEQYYFRCEITNALAKFYSMMGMGDGTYPHRSTPK